MQLVILRWHSLDGTAVARISTNAAEPLVQIASFGVTVILSVMVTVRPNILAILCGLDGNRTVLAPTV